MPDIPDQLVTGLQCRQSLKVHDIDAAKGLLTGRCVPYDEPTELWGGLWEVFSRGAFGAQVKARDHWARVQLRWAHATDEVPLGRATSLQDREDGLWGVFQWNLRLLRREGSRAWEVWQSLDEGDLTDLSIGFRTLKPPIVTEDDDRILVTRGKDSCHLEETSVVPSGAYGPAATVASLRAAHDTWREEWTARIDALRST